MSWQAKLAARRALLFDLGNTLVRYWDRPEFPGILRQAIRAVRDYLRQEGLLHVSSQVVWRNVGTEDRESPDHRVRPLEGRLAHIFQLDESLRSAAGRTSGLLEAMCRRFVAPMFARGQLYDDALPALEEARARGMRTAIVSNTPWGSPADLWREEIGRLGLRERVDAVVFCGDVGWRKPARQIFEYALACLQVDAGQCVFVGDDPRWDLVGPRALGMQAVLIDRHGTAQLAEEKAIQDLGALWDRIGLS